MKTRLRTINQIIEDQVQEWNRRQQPLKEEKEVVVPVITVSREPGSGGNVLAWHLSQAMGFSLFHQEVIHSMAESSNVSARLLETLDERGLNVLEHWINSLVDRRHLWPDQYMKHLLKVIGTLGRHGNAVLIGRGANFLLPAEKRFALRVICPREIRIKKVAQEFEVTPEEANRRIIRTESNRQSFIRKYFNADIDDQHNYDLIVNTGNLSMDTAVAGAKAAFEQWFAEKK